MKRSTMIRLMDYINAMTGTSVNDIANRMRLFNELIMECDDTPSKDGTIGHKGCIEIEEKLHKEIEALRVELALARVYGQSFDPRPRTCLCGADGIRPHTARCNEIWVSVLQETRYRAQR